VKTVSQFSDRIAPVAVTFFRISLCAWVGGAALFVMTSVAEQTSPEFGSMIRDQLATIRFPWYYAFGGISLAIALISGVAARICCHGCIRKRITASLVFTLLSAVIAALDYVAVYRPLQEQITPPGQARSQRFVELHNQSRHINELHITLALIAAVLAVLPSKGELMAGCELRIPAPSPDPEKRS
jgi:hypothetical protein